MAIWGRSIDYSIEAPGYLLDQEERKAKRRWVPRSTGDCDYRLLKARPLSKGKQPSINLQEVKMEFATYLDIIQALGVSAPNFGLLAALAALVLLPALAAWVVDNLNWVEHTQFEIARGEACGPLPEEYEAAMAAHEAAIQAKVEALAHLAEQRRMVLLSGAGEAPEPGFVKPRNTPATYREFVSQLVESHHDLAELEWLCQSCSPCFVASFTGGHKKGLDWIQAKAESLAA